MAKRIIDGKTYNTETATRIAAVNLQPQDQAEFDELYQTRHGAYFRYYGDWAFSDHNGPMEEIRPLTPPEAQRWMEQHAGASLVEKHFGEQPEAGETESRVTFRIPDTLKNRIETIATAHSQSLNAWIMRCVESCAIHDTERKLKPLVQRGYKFSGPNADRNNYLYGLFRSGAHLDLLARACDLTLYQAELIIIEGNGGKMPTVFFDGNGDILKSPLPER